MKFIRAVEEKIAERYAEQEMRCPIHLSIGQEATAAAIGLSLDGQDKAVSSHRSHAHYLAMGGNVGRMIAELYGKATGCCSGRGGSMHLTDLDAGFIASTAIVGNSIPVGAGLAMAEKLRGSSAIVVIFIGEGATETGVFAETVNFTAVHQLPILFVCENNLYSVYTPMAHRQPSSMSLVKKISHMGIASSSVDGTDVVAQFEHFRSLVSAVRGQQVPHFVECLTYRYLEHCGPDNDDHLGYRPQEELQEWKARDPVEAFSKTLKRKNYCDDKLLNAMDIQIRDDVNAAFDFAVNSPFPDQTTAFEDLFAKE